MGYSQKDVAKIFEFKSTSRISRWERGESMPNVKNLLKLSFLYSTLPNELYADLWEDIRKKLREKKITFKRWVGKQNKFSFVLKALMQGEERKQKIYFDLSCTSLLLFRPILQASFACGNQVNSIEKMNRKIFSFDMRSQRANNFFKEIIAIGSATHYH